MLPKDHPTIAFNLATLGRLLINTGRTKDAEPLLRESLAIRQKVLPKGHGLTANTEILLGGCLSEQQRYAEAEPLLLSGYETLKKAPGVPPRVIREALERIIRLYDAWGKAEEAEKWRKELSELAKPGTAQGSK